MAQECNHTAVRALILPLLRGMKNLTMIEAVGYAQTLPIKTFCRTSSSHWLLLQQHVSTLNDFICSLFIYYRLKLSPIFWIRFQNASQWRCRWHHTMSCEKWKLHWTLPLVYVLTRGGLSIISANMQCLYRPEDSVGELKKYTEQTGFNVEPVSLHVAWWVVHPHVEQLGPSISLPLLCNLSTA